MNIAIEKSSARGRIIAPPSKSILHRYIICASLSGGTSVIDNVDMSKDISASLKCAQALGAKLKHEERRITVTGSYGKTVSGPVRFDCNESGSTMRFFIGVALGLGVDSSFYGSETLLGRPMGIYEDICRDQGILFEKHPDHIHVFGKLKPGIFEIPGNISSQFITGLMFALPILDDQSTIKIIPPVESGSYIDLTLDAMDKFGITIDRISDTEYRIPGGQKYCCTDLVAEGDMSNAAFLDAFNLLGGNVTVEGLNPDSLQGDRVYGDLFSRLKDENACIDISDCPDLGPVLMGIAALNNGAVFTGTARLKIKESDRGSVMCEELKKMGVRTLMKENEITVFRSKYHAPEEPIDSHNDHRIAMTFSVLLSVTGGTIVCAEAVQKSYPGFYDDISSLGIKVIKNL